MNNSPTTSRVRHAEVLRIEHGVLRLSIEKEFRPASQKKVATEVKKRAVGGNPPVHRPCRVRRSVPRPDANAVRALNDDPSLKIEARFAAGTTPGLIAHAIRQIAEVVQGRDGWEMPGLGLDHEEIGRRLQHTETAELYSVTIEFDRPAPADAFDASELFEGDDWKGLST